MNPAKVALKKGRNLPKVKADNLAVVVQALRKLQPIARTTLADVTGLTAATITNMVDELGELDLVVERPSEERQVGRRPTLLTLNRERGHVIGVEISRSRIRVVRSNFGGDVLARVERPFKPGQVKRNLAQIKDVIAELAGGPNLLGIGVGVPGPVNSALGLVVSPPNFGAWHNVELAETLGDAFGVRCWLDDDAKTAAFGEAWYGAGQNVSTLLYISLRSGIGAGLIVNDRVYRGTHELAGEIGHTTIHVDGPLCECGNRGCVETLVSVPAILLEARRLGLDAPDLETLRSLADAGEPRAVQVRERTHTYLTATLLNAVNHYDPDVIVLGGQLVSAWPDLTGALAAKVQGRSFGFLSKDVRIEPSVLGKDATALGGVALVIDQVLRDPHGVLRPLAAAESAD